MTRDRSLINKKFFIGIDIGSVSTNIVALTSKTNLSLLERIQTHLPGYQLFQIENAHETLSLSLIHI